MNDESEREAERIVASLDWMNFNSLAPKELANAIATALRRARESKQTVATDDLWAALIQECCQKPDEAKMIVFLSEDKFRKAMARINTTTQPASNEKEGDDGN